MEMKPIIDRVRRRLKELNRSPIEAAEKGGLQRDFISNLIKNEKKESFGVKYLTPLYRALEWTVADLLGLGAQNGSRGKDITIPEFEVRGGAAYGGGFSQEENTTDASGYTISTDVIRARWGIPIPFLREELRLRPDRVHILPVSGDSMQDALFDGDRVIVDLDSINPSQGGIFALLDDNGEVIIKQVELVRGKGPKRIICKSRNLNYGPFELLLEEPVRIIGRVAGKITRL